MIKTRPLYAVRGALAAVLGIFLLASGTLSSAQLAAGTAAQAAAEAAQAIEQKMRNAGIRLTPEDVKAIKAIETRRSLVMQMYRELSSFQTEFTKKGDSTKAKLVDADKSKLRMIQKGLPAADGTVGGYYMEIKRYLSGPAKKHSQWMDEVKSSMSDYTRALANAPKPTATTAAYGSGLRAGWEVYIIGVSDRFARSASGKESGYIEFYVNNVKVTGNGQKILLPASGTVNVRAFVVGDVRTKWRKFEAPANTTLLNSSDYRVRYEVQSGSFRGLTDWYVETEQYAWKVLSAPNAKNVKYGFYSSSGNNALQSDLASFAYEGAFSCKLSVSGVANWKANSKRPNGDFQPKDSEAGAGEIQFSVGPRG